MTFKYKASLALVTLFSALAAPLWSMDPEDGVEERSTPAPSSAASSASAPVKSPKHQGELGRKVKPCEGWTAVLYFSTSFSDKPEAPGDTPYPYLLTDEQAKEIALHADPLSLAALDDLASFQILPALKKGLNPLMMPTLSNTDEFDFETREVDHFLLFVPLQDMRSESSGFMMRVLDVWTGAMALRFRWHPLGGDGGGVSQFEALLSEDKKLEHIASSLDDACLHISVDKKPVRLIRGGENVWVQRIRVAYELSDAQIGFLQEGSPDEPELIHGMRIDGVTYPHETPPGTFEVNEDFKKTFSEGFLTADDIHKYFGCIPIPLPMHLYYTFKGHPVGHFGWIVEKDGLRFVDFDKEKLSAEPPGHRALLGNDPS